jgi:hypothetical protein
MKLVIAPMIMLVGCVALAQETPATLNPDAGTPSGFGLLLGYKSVPLKQIFAHDTNPGDSFLPNANVPGSAGTTSLNRAQYIDFGLRYETPLADKSKWSLNLDVAGLFAYTSGNGADSSGMNLDDRQNANDNRPAANAAFIYTDSNWGFDTTIGVDYSFSKHFYAGVAGDFTGVYVDNGWDRYSNFQSQSAKWVLIPTGGPKLGWRITERSAIEGTILFGKNGVGFNAGLVWHF